MKECRVLHINDGKPAELHNKDYFFVEEFTKAEELLQEYINDGYEVKLMVPSYMPNRISFEQPDIAFFDSGITVYLEREI